MIKALIDNIKGIVSISLIIAALGTIGAIINSVIPWEWLSYFFILIRNFLSMIDFVVDTKTLLILLGLGITVQIALWGFKGVMFIVKWFKGY